ncbi:hypothetical protein DICVIV_11795 [Dictyocaulus viviparus]|uniref:Uncharacterized protein n=1 Tax=Dictyocaulus viviparus TaxID=29172 RepID=A0A0D8XIS7_DICVI|nr:hypothetical protein DICVIV_11795 [Dictyocaulus viviparus]
MNIRQHTITEASRHSFQFSVGTLPTLSVLASSSFSQGGTAMSPTGKCCMPGYEAERDKLREYLGIEWIPGGLKQSVKPRQFNPRLSPIITLKTLIILNNENMKLIGYCAIVLR